MNMFLHELKAYRKSTLLWTITLAALAVFFLSLYPSFTKDVEATRKLLDSFPENIKKALDISLESFFTLTGFYSYMFLYVVLCGAIQAMNLGTSIVSKEVRDKTADFLLTKPVSRVKILTSKLLAALVSLVFTNAVYTLAAFAMATAVKSEPFSRKVFFLISLSLFLIQLIFLALGILVSVLVPKIRSVLPVSLGTVFGFIVLRMLDSVIGERTARYFIPFLYYDNNYVMKHAAYEVSFVAVEFLFIAAAVTASYVVYMKRDIHAV